MRWSNEEFPRLAQHGAWRESAGKVTIMRYIVYETKDGFEVAFRMDTVEDEQYERAQAEREMHSRDTDVAGYHFEDIPGESRSQLRRKPVGHSS